MLYRIVQQLFGLEDKNKEIIFRDYGVEARMIWWYVLCQAITLRETQLLRLLVRAGAPLTYDGPLVEYAPWRNALEPAMDHISTDIFELLLKLGADVNRKNLAETLLHRVVRREKGGLVHCQLLLDYGADPNVSDDSGRTALHVAVQSGSADYVQLLLRRGANIDALDFSGQTALTLSVYWNQWGIFRILLANKIHVNDILLAKAIGFGTMSHIDATVKNVASYRLPSNVFPGDTDNQLFEAVRNGKLRRLEELLQNNRMLGLVRNSDRQLSPLHVAVFFKYTDVSKLLIELGANVLAEDGHGCTPVDYIMNLNCAEMLLLFFDMKKCFIDEFMRSAVRNNQPHLVRILLNLGGNVFTRFSDGRSFLEHAYSSNNIELLETLLLFGADSNVSVIDGTLLHRSNFSRAVDLLLEYGGDVNRTDIQGETPLTKQCPNQRCYNIAISRHFIRARAAGFQISARNLAHSKNMWCSDLFAARCETEIALLKKEKANPFGVSLFDVLSANLNRVAELAQNQKTFQSLTTMAAQRGKFEIYAGMIRAKLNMGRTRLVFLKRGTQSLEPVFPTLPILCLENIVSFLSNEDIHNCCLAFR